MGKKPKKRATQAKEKFVKTYPNTGWGREAKAEDLQREEDARVRSDGPRVYTDAYDEAPKLHTQGNSEQEIFQAIDTPPDILPPLNDGRFPFHREAHNQEERALAEIRRRAIRDALSGQPRNPPS